MKKKYGAVGGGGVINFIFLNVIYTFKLGMNCPIKVVLLLKILIIFRCANACEVIGFNGMSPAGTDADFLKITLGKPHFILIDFSVFWIFL
jgi:hypothetical protein